MGMVMVMDRMDMVMGMVFTIPAIILSQRFIKLDANPISGFEFYIA